MNREQTVTEGIAQGAAAGQRLEAEIARVMVGQRQVVREIVTALIAGGHVLVEGVPGLGKTLLVRALARAAGSRFNRIQFTPDLMPADITGHFMFERENKRFVVRKGPVFCHFLLADEINRAPAKTQSALLEAMQEQQVTIEGRTFPLERPFLVMATQNPVEQEGTYPLPQAQTDRFMFKVFITYPGEEEELHITRRVTHQAVGDALDLEAVRPVLTPDQVISLQETAAGLVVDDQITAYVVRIVRATREWNGVVMGAGPRGSIGLLRAARAMALLEGRGFVIPDDVKQVAPAVLRHRLILAADLHIEGYTPDHVLSELLASVDAPRT
ncbi:MAG TPA: MoxR family ATPase [Desulfobulbus sp.]|nr:MoxR family ATPase [Desulfobulbus sp.]